MVRSLQPTGILTAISGAENPVVLSTLWAGRRKFYTGILYFALLDNMDYEFASEDL